MGRVSQRVMINRTIDINRSSMVNRVLRKLAINRNPLGIGVQLLCENPVDLTPHHCDGEEITG